VDRRGKQLGSVLFMVSAVASLVRAEGDEIAVGIANWGTLTGALCFAVAGVLQEFERPPQPDPGLDGPKSEPISHF
jgi:hypothetical protein